MTKGQQISLFAASGAPAYSDGSSTPHTPGHHACPACSELRRMFSSSLSGSLPFEEAADLFLRMRRVDTAPSSIASGHYIKPHTLQGYAENIRTLGLFFGGMRLESIELEHLRAYQAARVTGSPPFVRYRRPQDAKWRTVNGVRVPPLGKTPCAAKPAKIMQELNLLIRILRRANCWSEQQGEIFEHLQGGETETQRALTPEEQSRWMEVARSRERWAIVHWWSIIAIDGCLSTHELRGLRIGDANLHHRVLSVPWGAAKNRFRRREIAIENPECLWALEQVLVRARDLGASEPTHFLWPFRDKRTGAYDVTRPMTVTGMNVRWNEVRSATGLRWFRPNDCRHTGATRLAEMGVTPEIIIKRLGHANAQMREHYTHISLSAQRRWLRDPQQMFALQQPSPQWYPPVRTYPMEGPRAQRVVMVRGHRVVVTA